MISHKIYQHPPAVALSKQYGSDSGPMPAAFSARMVILYLLSGLISVRLIIGTAGPLTAMVVCRMQLSLVESVMGMQ